MIKDFSKQRTNISSLLNYYTKTDNTNKRIELLTDLIHLYGAANKRPSRKNKYFHEITEVITTHTRIVTKNSLTKSEYSLLQKEVKKL